MITEIIANRTSLLKTSSSFVLLFCGRIIRQLIIYESRQSMFRTITLSFWVFLFFLISHMILVVVGGCQYIYIREVAIIDRCWSIREVLLKRSYWTNSFIGSNLVTRLINLLYWIMLALTCFNPK